MNNDFEILKEVSKRLSGDTTISKYVRCGHVACALKTKNGNVFTGISINAKCGIGFCAEHSAIADMLKAGESKIEKLVSSSGDVVLVPCGRCLEFIRQLDDENLDTEVLLENDKIMKIKDLLPVRWDIEKI